MELGEQLTLNWRSAVLATTAAACLVCAILCVRSPYERSAALYLAAFAFVALMTSVPLIIGFAGAYRIYPELTFLPTQMTLLFGPLFYLHAHSLMLGKPRRWAYWLLVPGGFHLLYQMILFSFLPDGEAKLSFNQEFNYPYVLPVVFGLGAGLALWALVKVWTIRLSYLKWLEDKRSDAERFDPSWLRDYILLSIPLFLVWIAENLLGRFLELSYADLFWADAFSLFIVFLMVARAAQGLQVSFPKMGDDVVEHSQSTERQRDWVLEGERLRELVAKHRLYLDSEFSLTDLSQRAAMNENYVSRAINVGLSRNFNDLINGFRVEQAKVLLMENSQGISEIAFNSGFASKSSFNRSFRKLVGMSPSEFRRKSG